MRLGNPSVRRWISKQQRGEVAINNEPASYAGVCKKTLVFGFITIVSALIAVIGLNVAIKNASETLLTTILIAAGCSALPMIVLAIMIGFMPNKVKVLGSIYCVLQGITLGLVVYFVDLIYPGIAFAALLGTLIVFVICVALNKMLEVKISSKFYRGALIAFVSLIAVELLMWVLSMFGVVNFMAYFWIQLGISALCIVMATISLLWDLQTVDYLVQTGADRAYEWNVAFSLVTTLIYLYLEILELLLRLAAIFGRGRD